MAGNKQGGLKARDANLQNNPNHYRDIGRKGGSTPTKMLKGFAAMSYEQRREAGMKGGIIRGEQIKANGGVRKKYLSVEGIETVKPSDSLL